MGCASSKKRTTSVDDLTGQGKNKEPSSQPPGSDKNKNGQLATTANDVKPIKKESSHQTSSAPPPQSDTSAIQIPGTHRSFLAPDGIPFIDEDIDEDAETGGKGDISSIPVDNAVIKPDVNKNVVKGPSVPDQQPKEPVPPPAVSVEKDIGKKPDVPVVDERRREDIPPALPVSEPPSEPSPIPVPPVADSTQKSEEQADEENKRAVAMEILTKELDIFTASEHHETATSITVTESEPVAAETVPSIAEPVRAVTPDDQEKAAVKIQAGIRGYRDRQRVKALRAAKETASNESSAVHSAETSSEVPNPPDDKPVISHSDVVVEAQDPDVAQISVEINEANQSDSIHEDDLDDPEKQRAATKIQASFKGYKTRKELGKIKK